MYNRTFAIEPNEPPYISRDGLSSEILVLRANLEYYGIEFTNLGTPERRTVQCSIPKDYVQGKVPVYSSMRIQLGYGNNPLECRVSSDTLNLKFSSMLHRYITLDDLYNDIIKEERRINRPITDSVYREMWRKHALMHIRVAIAITQRDIVMTTDDMAKRMNNFFKMIGQTVQL